MKDGKSFLRFAGRVIIVHTVTYFVFGLIMSNFLDYKELFKLKPISDFMKPIHSGWVFAGPFLQPLRGLVFAVGLWPFRQLIMEKRNGWLLIWGLLLAFGIIGPPAAAPSSMEGIIYSKLPLWYHLMGLPEIMLQTLTFSILLFGWERKKDTNHQEMKGAKLHAIHIFKAIVIGCYAYIGYAVGSLLSLLISSIQIDFNSLQKIKLATTMNINFEAGAGNLKIQLMFVVAFVVNVICIYLFNRQKEKIAISNWFLLLFFLVIDTFVPYIYQFFMLGGVPAFHFSLLIGFFPAVIIWLSLGVSMKSRK